MHRLQYYFPVCIHFITDCSTLHLSDAKQLNIFIMHLLINDNDSYRLSTVSIIALELEPFFGKVICITALNFAVVSSMNKTALNLLYCNALGKFKRCTRASRRTA